MSNVVTRKNHYVPRWYQEGFYEKGQSRLQYLDMTPAVLTIPGGKTVTMNAINHWGSKMCFWERDLYSLHFRETVNDDIERHLFGSIDVRGARAVRAFIEGDASDMHDSFEDFFEYMDAQKLRTPKGLDWIKERYGSLKQHQLMVEMQSLRYIHCAMWTEGIRELVVANDSDVKFIVSDHPVTLYNAACSPDDERSRYPEDPALEWLGTQTVFVLDANTCLILSHLEYAKTPRRKDLTAPRTNARYRGQSLVRTDAFVRTRKLNAHEVTAVNYLLKRRARRYIAAANSSWLYPENSFKGSWEDIASVLRPQNELWQFGGEIIVGYKDGSSHYQDEFGRTSGAHKYLVKKKRPEPGENQFCGCGSGRTFKLCCRDIPTDARPSWTVYSIRERNLMFCHHVKNVLGLDAGKSWLDVRKDLSVGQIEDIHKAYASLWPTDTDFTELLPRPREQLLRMVYLGYLDPRTVAPMVLGWLPFFDEILVASPFPIAHHHKPEYNATKSGAKFKAQTLKNVALLLQLEPFIDAGDVLLIPDMMDIDLQFGHTVMKMMDKRSREKSAEYDLNEWQEALLEDDQLRLTLQMPKDSLVARIRKFDPDASDQIIQACVEHNRKALEKDPFAPMEPFEAGEKNVQFHIYKGLFLENGMYLAALTGACLYTDGELHWDQLHKNSLSSGQVVEAKELAAVVNSVEIPIEVELSKLGSLLREDVFGGVRTALKRALRVCTAADSPVDPAVLLADLSSEMQSARSASALGYKGLELNARIEVSAPGGGFCNNEVGRLLLTFGRRKNCAVPFAVKITVERLDGLKTVVN